MTGTEPAVSSVERPAALAMDTTPFDGFIREYRDSTVTALRRVGRWRDRLPVALVLFLIAMAIAGVTEILRGTSLSASLLFVVGLLAVGLAVTRQ